MHVVLLLDLEHVSGKCNHYFQRHLLITLPKNFKGTYVIIKWHYLDSQRGSTNFFNLVNLSAGCTSYVAAAPYS